MCGLPGHPRPLPLQIVGGVAEAVGEILDPGHDRFRIILLEQPWLQLPEVGGWSLRVEAHGLLSLLVHGRGLQRQGDSVRFHAAPRFA
jgi:hypothetical protein